ncbi:MAG TPA: Spy/CpxP family protein refolding chaperone [Blastocatellia bacterium]|nr:Spy/CpxP family protein refolding chaperone [Blastocatellia bacterium]
MTKKLFITGFALVIVSALFGAQTSALSQFRGPKARQEGGRPGKFNRRLDRVNRPPLPDPQPDRPAQRRPGLGPEQKRRLQQQLMQAIGLTDDQRTRMADIRRSHEDALISAGRRLRQARQALDRAIMNEQYDEALIHQRADELAAAQADMIRLQTRVRAQVRSVLTSEQVTKFNELERRLRRQMREQRENQMNGESQSTTGPRTPPDLEDLDLVSLLLFKE